MCALSNSLVHSFYYKLYYKHIMYLGSALVIVCNLLRLIAKVIVQLVINHILSIPYTLTVASSMAVIFRGFWKRGRLHMVFLLVVLEKLI
mgnify:FL=1